MLDRLPLFFVGFLGAGITAFFVTYGVLFVLRLFGCVDKPHLYPHESGRQPLPYPGGIALICNMIVWFPWMVYMMAEGDIKKSVYVLIGGLLVSSFMAWDDQKRSLSPLFRLMFQICLGGFFGLTAVKIGYVTNIFGGIVMLDNFSFLQWSFFGKTIYAVPFIVTIVWYVLVMNALNWSDNGRGMTSSITLVASIVLFLLSLQLYVTDTSEAARSNSLFVLTFLTIFVPTMLVFWRFDVMRKCIVGDSGTMFMGFMLATLASIAGGKIATVSTVLGIYFIDAFYVIISRIRAGKNPLRGDLNHLHHRLAQQGVSHATQRNIVMILSLLFGISALFLHTWGKIGLFLAILLVVIYIVEIAFFYEKAFQRKKDSDQ